MWISKSYYDKQGRSQILKAVPQHFMEDFKVDDVTANDVIQKKQHHLIKKRKATKKGEPRVVDKMHSSYELSNSCRE